MSGERSVTYSSQWIGQLCGQQIMVELEIYNFHDGNWSWRARMFDEVGTPSHALWFFDYTKMARSWWDAKVPLNFPTHFEAHNNASAWLVKQGFGLSHR